MKRPKGRPIRVPENAPLRPDRDTEPVSKRESVEIEVNQNVSRGEGAIIGVQLDELGPDNKPAPRKKQGNE